MAGLSLKHVRSQYQLINSAAGRGLLGFIKDINLGHEVRFSNRELEGRQAPEQKQTFVPL